MMAKRENKIPNLKSHQKFSKLTDAGCMIRFRCGTQNIIYDVLLARSGWIEVTGECEWDFIWNDKYAIKEIYDNQYLEEHVKRNHFRNYYELTHKNLMAKNLMRLKKQVEKDHGKLEAVKFDFFPTTFELPGEYHMFVEEFKKHPGKIWIMKPIAKSQGIGIFLFKKLKDIIQWRKEDYPALDDKNKDKEQPEAYIAQRYIDNPYLIDGKKFDLRVYVLVTSYIPLKAWLYRDGFARFASTGYSLNSIDDQYIHLTNVAIQKNAPDYDPVGSKWSIYQLRRYLTARHGAEPVEDLFRLMDDIFIKSLQSVQRITINDKHCFQLYGYDILIDSELKPWLVEINPSPSLTASNDVDYQLKFAMLNDVINIVDMEGRLSGKEKRVGGFDLMWNDGPVNNEERCISDCSIKSNTFLGCYNDREKQLEDMFQALELSRASQLHS